MLTFILFLAFLFWAIHIHLKVSDMETTIESLKLDFLRNQEIDSNKNLKMEDNIEYSTNSENNILPTVSNRNQTEILDVENNENSFDEDIEDFSSSNKIYEEKFIYEKDKEKNSFENFFIGNLFNIIGAIAIIIGCGIFVKLIQPYIIFTPLLKTLIGLICGIAMVIGGCVIKKDTLKIYSEILTGTGFAVLFITIYCTTILFETFSQGVCAFLGIIILLAAYYIADKQKTSSMLAISLIGGYLNLFLINSTDSYNNVYIYLIFLNLLSATFILRNPEKSAVNIINLIATLIFSIILNITNSINIWYPITLWSIYLIADFIIKNREAQIKTNSSILNWTNLACLICLGLMIYKETTVNIALLLLGVAIIYGIIFTYFAIKNPKKSILYLDSMLISTLIAVYFICEDATIRIAIWSIIATLLSVVIWKYKADFLKNRVIIFLSCSVINLLLMPELYCYEYDIKYIPVFNTRLLAFISPIIGFYISHLFLNKSNNEDTKNLSTCFKFCALTLIYLFVILELNNYITIKTDANEIVYNHIKPILYSIIGFIYAIQMRRYETIYKNGVFYIASVIAYGLSIVVLLYSGFSYTPIETFIPVINIRFMAFLTAIFSSILFAKWTKFDIYKYIAVILGFILMSIEVIDYINKFNLTSNYIVSILWILYVGIITTIGILKGNKVLKNSGIWLSFLVLARIFIYDLANIETVYKLIIFITLGIIFMVTSYIYNKNKKE